jgi:VWFA-related protein
MMRVGWNRIFLLLLASFISAPCAGALAQKETTRNDGGGGRRGGVRSMTIPVTIKLPEKRQEEGELQYLENFTIFEDNEQQEVLAARGAPTYPLTLVVLVQDDLDPTVGTEIAKLARFIRNLPQGSRVMVGYLRAGSLQVRQKFTSDLERAAKQLRVPTGSAALAPFNPFTLTRDAVKKFESQPVGRRAVLLISDGLDVSRGAESSTPTQSFDLQRSIDEAQRRGAAVYSIYAPTTGGRSRTLAGNGQSSLERLSEETGGRAFIQTVSAPVVLEPHLREIEKLLSTQFALTYLSTHSNKGFHRIRIITDLPDGEVRYPPGYTR